MFSTSPQPGYWFLTSPLFHEQIAWRPINTDVSAVVAVKQDNKCLILLSHSDRKNKFVSAHCLKNKMLDILFRVK